MKSQPKKTIFSALLAVPLLVLAPGVVSGIENFESLKVLTTELPVYPVRMAYEGIYAGSARVIINVDGTGKLVDVFLESYSHPEFGRLADKYIRLWTFQPAKLNGEPINAIKPVDFFFDDKRGVYSLNMQEAVAAMINFGGNTNSKRLYSPEELDEAPVPLEVARPLFPEEFRGTGMSGTASVDFYIDEGGKIRMPHVTDYSHQSFGLAALLALEQWKFKAPRVKGKPVTIMLRQSFVFSRGAKE